MLPKQTVHITFTPPEALLAARMPTNVSALWHTNATLRRLLRSVGTEESFLTGNGADFEKFSALLAQLSALRDSALYEAVEAELDALDGLRLTQSADVLWRALSTPFESEDRPPLAVTAAAGVQELLLPFSPDRLPNFANYPVNGAENIHAAPILHPDPLLSCDRGFTERINALAGVSGSGISDLASLTAALESSVEQLKATGGEAVLHDGLLEIGFARPDPYHAEEAFRRALATDGRGLSPQERALLHTQFLRIIGRLCVKHGLHAVLLAPAADTLCDRSEYEDNFKISDTVCGRFSENGFCALIDYLRESDALPPLTVGLSPDAPAGLLPRLAGKFPAENGIPPILWGIDGRNATARDMEAMLRAILRRAGAGAYAGILVEEEGFLTAPRTRLLAKLEAAMLGQTGETDVSPSPGGASV